MDGLQANSSGSPKDWTLDQVYTKNLKASPRCNWTVLGSKHIRFGLNLSLTFSSRFDWVLGFSAFLKHERTV